MRRRGPGLVGDRHHHVIGGGSAGDDFNADAYLSGLEKLAAVGVTWVQASVPGDSLAHAVETIERFGKSVIASA
jgi:hypothetical protein